VTWETPKTEDLAATRAIARPDLPAYVAAPRSDRGAARPQSQRWRARQDGGAMHGQPRCILHYKGISLQLSRGWFGDAFPHGCLEPLPEFQTFGS
jgi:hypothetical protein